MRLTTNIIKKGQQGFTLIELLIVIAILGVLAAAVLVAINPLEQIARGKDAGRESTIDQVGHAIQSYYTSQSTYPTVNATWNNTLTNAGELKQFPTVQTGSLNGWATCTNNKINEICYALLGAGPDVVVYTGMESSSSMTKAGACASPNRVFAAWYSSTGKTGIVCAANDAAVIGSALQQY